MFLYSSYDYGYSSEPSGWLIFLLIVMIVWGVLEIILFFKVWKMTDNVSELTQKMTNSGNDNNLLYLYSIGDKEGCLNLLNSKLYSRILSKYISPSANAGVDDFENKRDEVISTYKPIYEKYGLEIPEKFTTLTTKDIYSQVIFDNQL